MNTETGWPLWRYMMCAASPRPYRHTRAPSSSMPGALRGFRQRHVPSERRDHGALGRRRIGVGADHRVHAEALHVIGGQLGGQQLRRPGWSAHRRTRRRPRRQRRRRGPAARGARATRAARRAPSGALADATRCADAAAPRTDRAAPPSAVSPASSVRLACISSRTACSAATREWHGGQTRTCSSTSRRSRAPMSPSMYGVMCGSIDSAVRH